MSAELIHGIAKAGQALRAAGRAPIRPARASRSNTPATTVAPITAISMPGMRLMRLKQQDHRQCGRADGKGASNWFARPAIALHDRPKARAAALRSRWRSRTASAAG